MLEIISTAPPKPNGALPINTGLWDFFGNRAGAYQPGDFYDPNAWDDPIFNIPPPASEPMEEIISTAPKPEPERAAPVAAIPIARPPPLIPTPEPIVSTITRGTAANADTFAAWQAYRAPPRKVVKGKATVAPALKPNKLRAAEQAKWLDRLASARSLAQATPVKSGVARIIATVVGALAGAASLLTWPLDILWPSRIADATLPGGPKLKPGDFATPTPPMFTPTPMEEIVITPGRKPSPSPGAQPWNNLLTMPSLNLAMNVGIMPNLALAMETASPLPTRSPIELPFERLLEILPIGRLLTRSPNLSEPAAARPSTPPIGSLQPLIDPPPLPLPALHPKLPDAPASPKIPPLIGASMPMMMQAPCPPCESSKKDKEKEKKKTKKQARKICYRGTYVEKSKSLSKTRKEQVPCQ